MISCGVCSAADAAMKKIVLPVAMLAGLILVNVRADRNFLFPLGLKSPSQDSESALPITDIG
jgi:hypothetical protein